MNVERRFERFNIEIMNVTGRIVWSHIVTIKAITRDVVILSTDARMNLGKKYILHIDDQGNSFNVGGTVTASAIDELTVSPDGETMPLYRAEIKFDDSTGMKLEQIERFISLLSQEVRPVLSHLKLWADIPGESNAVTEPCRIKEIGIGGMRVECPTPHEVGCIFRFLMSLPDVATLRVRAKIVWCTQSDENNAEKYDLGLAFTDMSETDFLQLQSFIHQLQQPQETDVDLWRHEKL